MAIELVEPTKLGVWFLSKWSTSSQDQKVPNISQINDFRVLISLVGFTITRSQIWLPGCARPLYQYINF